MTYETQNNTNKEYGIDFDIEENEYLKIHVYQGGEHEDIIFRTCKEEAIELFEDMLLKIKKE